MAEIPNVTKSSVLSHESLKVISESVGISNLSDESSYALAEDATFRIKLLVQESIKFMRRAKRVKLSAADFDHALQDQNIEPLYGFTNPDFITFRFASGGGREVHFVEEKDLDLSEMINSPLPKVPVDISMKAHWLCVEGVQPAIPENPPPVEQEAQKIETTHAMMHPKPAMKSKDEMKDKDKILSLLDKTKGFTAEMAKLKPVLRHELSVEQQLYYKEITEACVGSSEPKRAQALQSLATDSGLYQMLPRFCYFISEGVRVNVVQSNLALLIYLMRMIKALMDNPTLYLEKYLHEIVPAVVTCIVSKQLCLRPDIDNHWALRDFASRLMAAVCKKFNTATNNLQARITKTFDESLSQENCPLPTLYGALAGLCELGTEVIKTVIILKLMSVGDRVKGIRDNPMASNFDRIAAEHLKQLIVKQCSPFLKQSRSPPDLPEAYTEEFGFLGSALCSQVSKLRTQPSTPSPQLGYQSKPTIHIPSQSRAASLLSPGSRSPMSAGVPRSTSLLANSRDHGFQRASSLPGGVMNTPSGKQTKIIVVSSLGQNTRGTSSSSLSSSSLIPSKHSQTQSLMKVSSPSPNSTGLSKSFSAFSASVKEEAALSQSMSAIEGSSRKRLADDSPSGTSMLMSLAHAATMQTPYKSEEGHH